MLAVKKEIFIYVILLPDSLKRSFAAPLQYLLHLIQPEIFAEASFRSFFLYEPCAILICVLQRFLNLLSPDQILHDHCQKRVSCPGFIYKLWVTGLQLTYTMRPHPLASHAERNASVAPARGGSSTTTSNPVRLCLESAR